MPAAHQDAAVVPARRARVGLALAAVGLAAAVIGALGPAERVGTTYSWPPPTLPDEKRPARLWYTPLFLVQHRPESLSARIPCTRPRPLPGADRLVTVLATARDPRGTGGLAVTSERDLLTVSVGASVLDRVRLARAPGADCSYRLSIGGGRWSLRGGPGGSSRDGALPDLPVVYGLFSEVDLRERPQPTVEVTAVPHATRAVGRQRVAWALAALALAGALIAVAVPRRPSVRALRNIARAGWTNAGRVDAVVLGSLTLWWLLAPAFFDDGWIYAKQSMFSAWGGFSTYFILHAANAPLGYWLDWLQHWLTQSTSELVLLRLPALLCLVATWVLCRLLLHRVLARSGAHGAVAVWSLAATFLVGAFAWGMTVRPEPVTALLVTGVAACMLPFVERQSAGAVGLAAVLSSLAATTHPTGVIALAPVLVALPTLARWARRQLATAAAVATTSVALIVLLSFVASDVDRRRADASAFRGYGVAADWWNELQRYDLLGTTFPYATPVRRLSVALMALALLAFVMRVARGPRNRVLGFPSSTLAVAMLLLAAGPSKWPWHFGTLAGVAAVAVAAEFALLRESGRRASSWRVRPLAALAAAVVAAAWAWSRRSPWNLADLRSHDWHPAFVSRTALIELAIVLPLVLACVAVVVALLRGRPDQRYEAPWRVAGWTAPILALPALAFTLGVLAVDTLSTESWTLGRANASALVGKSGCGLADDLTVPRLDSVRALQTEARAGTALPTSPEEARFVLASPGPTRTPWFELPASGRYGLLVAGVPGPNDNLAVEWRRGRVADVRPRPITSVIAEPPNSGPWQLFVAEELPSPPPAATLVRISFRSRPGGTRRVAVLPVAYRSERLAAQMAPAGTRTLVHPDLVPYFPCARLPRLSAGVAEAPTHLVAAGHPALPRSYYLSPLAGAGDVYDIHRLGTADSDDPPERIFAYELREPPGAKAAPAVARPS